MVRQTEVYSNSDTHSSTDTKGSMNLKQDAQWEKPDSQSGIFMRLPHMQCLEWAKPHMENNEWMLGSKKLGNSK